MQAGFDLGIRFDTRVEDGMIAKRLTPPMQEALFVSQAYVEQHGLPKTIEQLQQHALIQYRFISAISCATAFAAADSCVTVNMPMAVIVNDTDLMVDAAEQGLIGRIVAPLIQQQLIEAFNSRVAEHWLTLGSLSLYFHKTVSKRKVRVFIDFLPRRWRINADA